MPSRCTLLMTSRTRSGRDCAFWIRLLRANSAEARSVPADTTDAAMRTSTQPGSSCAAGTSSTVISPVRGVGELASMTHLLRPETVRPRFQTRNNRPKFPVGLPGHFVDVFESHFERGTQPRLDVPPDLDL